MWVNRAAGSVYLCRRGTWVGIGCLGDGGRGEGSVEEESGGI